MYKAFFTYPMLQTAQLHSTTKMSPHQLFYIIAPAEIALWVVAESFEIPLTYSGPLSIFLLLSCWHT